MTKIVSTSDYLREIVSKNAWTQHQFIIYLLLNSAFTFPWRLYKKLAGKNVDKCLKK